MRSLVYDTMSAGARVTLAVNGGPKDIFGGWDHMTNIITIAGKKYLLDVGFGGNGPTEPVPLEDGIEMRWGMTDDKVRVIWTRLSQFTSPDSRIWVLQHRRAGCSWDDIYAFTEMEFLPEDFEVTNCKATRDPRSWFNHEIVCVKTLLDENDDVVGMMLLTDGKVNKRIKGKNHRMEKCKSEDERVEASKKYFGIVLSPEERYGIKGMPSEL
jgi:arylamine N-acetyltransferase